MRPPGPTPLSEAHWAEEPKETKESNHVQRDKYHGHSHGKWNERGRSGNYNLYDQGNHSYG
ncbi:unnamed protein product [Arabidopsis halleri]